MINNI